MERPKCDEIKLDPRITTFEVGESLEQWKHMFGDAAHYPSKMLDELKLKLALLYCTRRPLNGLATMISQHRNISLLVLRINAR